MKRIISAVLILSVLIGAILCTTVTASAAGGTYGNLSWSFSNGTLTISGNGEMLDAGSSSGYPWSGYQYSADSVVIKDGVTSIGSYAFFCFDAYTVTIPTSVRYIAHRAFYATSTSDIYYGGSVEDRKALLSWGEWNHGLSNSTWHYSSHSHQWSLKSTTSATCTADGVKTYSCHCGNTKTETITKLGHNYSGTPSYTWTQTSGGYQVKGTKYCSRNSSHTVTETVTATYQEITAPTCTASGQGRYTATFTNAYFSTQTKTVTLSATGHSYTSVVTKPTCTQKGYTTYTCSKCGNVYKDNYVDMVQHPWGAGEVTKQPTCKEAGERTFTCTVCPATKKESIDKTNDHTYGPWTKANDSEHKHICSVCSKEEKADHKWNDGEITTQPTCKAEGVKTFTCAECMATRTEPVEKLPHTFGSWTNADTAEHKHTCSKCGAEETEKHTWNSGAVTKQPTCKEEGETTYTCLVCGGKNRVPIQKRQEHTYDNDCDTTCNICAFIRTVNHKYASAWSKDEAGHWKECTACGHRNEAAKHTPGPEATETTPQTCTACGYIVKPVIDHVCKFDEKWTSDKTGHWYACSGCEKKDRFAEHSFENDCDTDCSVCKYERKTTHSFAQSYSSDKTNHWFTCAACGEKKDVKAHEPGPEATETTAQTCTICEYEIAPALGKADTTEPTEDSVAVTDPTVFTEKPDDGDGEKTEFPWWIVIAVIGIAAILGIVLAVKKKR